MAESKKESGCLPALQYNLFAFRQAVLLKESTACLSAGKK